MCSWQIEFNVKPYSFCCCLCSRLRWLVFCVYDVEHIRAVDSLRFLANSIGLFEYNLFFFIWGRYLSSLRGLKARGMNRLRMGCCGGGLVNKSIKTCWWFSIHTLCIDLYFSQPKWFMVERHKIASFHKIIKSTAVV